MSCAPGDQSTVGEYISYIPLLIYVYLFACSAIVLGMQIIE